MHLTVRADRVLTSPRGRFRCALGRGGIVRDKREGDGATPAGRFALRRLWYRADRIGPLWCRLPARIIAPEDGWCDDPAHGDYNRPIRRPHPARHERLWLEIAIYDALIELGCNDRPVVPGAGSAIFLHIARPDFRPTEGCVALARAHLLALIGAVGPASTLTVEP